MIDVDSTATNNIKFLTTLGSTSTGFVHYYNDLAGICKYCGDKEGHDYVNGACWKCWRSRNPGLLAR